MDVRKCCIDNCPSTNRTNRLFKLPMHDKLRELWLSFLLPKSKRLAGLNKFQLVTKLVCQNHFDRHQFDGMGNRLRLGYPCLFSDNEIAHGVPLSTTVCDHLSDHNYSLSLAPNLPLRVPTDPPESRTVTNTSTEECGPKAVDPPETEPITPMDSMDTTSPEPVLLRYYYIVDEPEAPKKRRRRKKNDLKKVSTNSFCEKNCGTKDVDPQETEPITPMDSMDTTSPDQFLLTYVLAETQETENTPLTYVLKTISTNSSTESETNINNYVEPMETTPMTTMDVTGPDQVLQTPVVAQTKECDPTDVEPTEIEPMTPIDTTISDSDQVLVTYVVDKTKALTKSPIRKRNVLKTLSTNSSFETSSIDGVSRCGFVIRV